jgi:hypothetical protein
LTVDGEKLDLGESDSENDANEAVAESGVEEVAEEIELC